MATITLTGGCLCGRVRYRLTTDRPEAGHCHCSMCRKATGGATGLFISVPEDRFEWLAAEPKRFASSRIATRSFCPDCGSPLTYSLNGSGEIDVTVGSLDTPELVRPAIHVGVEARVASLAWYDGLPGRRTMDHPKIAAAWREAYGEDVEPGPEFRPREVNR